jgi:hypothetical protein
MTEMAFQTKLPEKNEKSQESFSYSSLYQMFTAGK